ncbi:MAG TPA: hypothetical protein VNO21_11820, partial [Polyangiaceae bacterium]|nr:hypothetical protein [Polyangiaceae bacterium]
GTLQPFPQIADATAAKAGGYVLTTSYREIQAVVTHFLETGFPDNGIPEVKDIPPLSRDIDGDLAPDATDSDPNDPSKH